MIPIKIENWTRDDIEERQYWDDYMEAYEECLGATSTRSRRGRQSAWMIRKIAD